LASIKFKSFTENEEKIKDLYLIIIDECSMINRDLYRLNKERALKFNIKLLYIGDSKQLTPISKDTNEMSPTFSVSHKFELKEIVRQEAGHPLLETFSLIREDVSNKTGRRFMNYISQNRSNHNENGGYKLYSESLFNKKILDFFKSEKFKEDLTFIRGLCFTNAKIRDRNVFVRNTLFNNPKDILVNGDLLTAYVNLYDTTDNGVIPLLLNSEDYTVDMVLPHLCDFNFKVYATNLTERYTNKALRTLLIVDHTDSTFTEFKSIANYLYEQALYSKYGSVENRKKLWYKWFKFQEKYLLLNDLKLYNGHIMKKSLDYGYFLTVHKAQGSTLQNVAIDMSDIYYPLTVSGKQYTNDIELANRLMYVALSRTKQYAIIKY
jgi:exodeoxyribonuclease-5